MQDILRLLSGQPGLRRWHRAGHDQGGWTAFALAALHPGSVPSLTVIDVVIPGDGEEFSQSGRCWYHAVHRTPDLPEALVGGRERACLGRFCRVHAARPDAIDAKAMEHDFRTCTDPETLRAGFAFYRNLPRDAADKQALLSGGFRTSVPVRAIGGRRTDAFGRAGKIEASRRRVATDVRELIAEESGHFVPKKGPALTARAIPEHVERCA